MKGYLFNQDVMNSMIDNSLCIVKADKSEPGVLHHKLCESLSFTGAYQMPVVQPTNCNPPSRIMALYRLKDATVSRDCVPHFYTKDDNFESVWNAPYKSLSRLHGFSSVISPDFSVYNELLYAQKVWNVFRNKLIAAWWQYNGIVVIPNISWPYGVDYAISFDGWPQHSVIAINSTGINRDTYSKHLWLAGYKELLCRLEPTHILRYGVKIKGEAEEISTYYPNDNIDFKFYGR